MSTSTPLMLCHEAKDRVTPVAQIEIGHRALILEQKGDIMAQIYIISMHNFMNEKCNRT